MIIDKQLIIMIIQYGSSIGLFLSGVLALFTIDKKKKFIFLFLMYIFAGILSFVLYSGFTFFTVGIVFVFFIIILYIVIIQQEIIKNNGREPQKPENKTGLRNGRKPLRNVLNRILPLLLCGGLGYLVFSGTYKYLAGAGYRNGEQLFNISFPDPGLAIKGIFSSYGLALIILVSALFISFLWFIVMVKLKDKKKNGEEE